MGKRLKLSPFPVVGKRLKLSSFPVVGKRLKPSPFLVVGKRLKLSPFPVVGKRLKLSSSQLQIKDQTLLWNATLPNIKVCNYTITFPKRALSFFFCPQASSLRPHTLIIQRTVDQHAGDVHVACQIQQFGLGLMAARSHEVSPHWIQSQQGSWSQGECLCQKLGRNYQYQRWNCLAFLYPPADSLQCRQGSHFSVCSPSTL